MVYSLSFVGIKSCSILYHVCLMSSSTGVMCMLCHTCFQSTCVHFVSTRSGLPSGVFWRSVWKVAYVCRLYARCVGFDPRTVQPVVSRYTDSATRPTHTLLMTLENPNKRNHLPMFKQCLQGYGSQYSFLQAKHKYIAVVVVRKRRNQFSVFWIGVNITYFLIENTLLRGHCCKLLASI
jgi:hypothetical protein